MRQEFEVHVLNETGLAKARQLGEAQQARCDR